MQKIKDNWQKTVGEDDFVIVPGDVSWATYLEQAVEDFKLLMSFGKKIISKGNHDYWWTTMSKLNNSFWSMILRLSFYA